MPRQRDSNMADKDVLAELCGDSSLSEAERKQIKAAWKALSPLCDTAMLPPRPSAGLEEIFQGRRAEVQSLTGNAALLHKRISADRADMKKITSLVDPEKRAAEIVRMGKAYGLPVSRNEVLNFLKRDSSCELCDEELEMVVGGKGAPGGQDGAQSADSGNAQPRDDKKHHPQRGADHDDTLTDETGKDTLYGGQEDDDLYGGDGSDLLLGGRGDDTLDGGWEDGSDDLAMGGEGDDTFIWGLSGDGNDTFEGGEGENRLELDLSSLDEEYGNLRQAFEDKTFSIALTDADGDPVELTGDLWDDEGNLNLPEGVTGTITGPYGETLSFTNVKTVTKY